MIQKCAASHMVEFIQTRMEKPDFVLSLPKAPFPGEKHVAKFQWVTLTSLTAYLIVKSSLSAQSFETDHENTQQIQMLRQCIWNTNSAVFAVPRSMCRVTWPWPVVTFLWDSTYHLGFSHLSSFSQETHPLVHVFTH